MPVMTPPLLLLLVVLLAPVARGGPLTASRAQAERGKRLRARGGSAATQNAVGAALGWLSKHPSRDGGWDADGFMQVSSCACDGKGGGWHGEKVPCAFDREVTALATLAFLGAGRTHRSGAHSKIVAAALDWLAAGSRRTTLFGTAYTTQALVEAYDLTGDAALRPAIERGVATMIGSRQPQGGWRYYPGMKMASGVPTTAAVVCALAAAEEAGFKVSAAYKQPVLEWLGRLVDAKNGRVAYTLDGHTMGYTPTTTNAASALLIRLRLGAPLDTRLLGAVAKRKPRWSIRFKRMKVRGVMREVQIGYLQHYYWHHATEALARQGGGAWSAWNGALKKALLRKQRRDGHLAGSWDPAGTYGKVGGRVFSTALCAMMLEAYYRY